MGKPVNVVTTAPAPARKGAVKKPNCKVSPCLVKKRKPAEDNESSGLDTSCPWKPRTSKADGEQQGALRQPGDGHWIAARRLLQGAVTPLRQRELAACKPTEVVTSSYLSLLQVNYELICITARAQCVCDLLS
jgi:hypothetical protein